MKRMIQQFLLGVCVLLVATAVQAADWDVNSVSKQSSSRPGAEATTDSAGNFLHVKLDVTGNAPNWSTFKVVNEQGEQVATPAGYNAKQSLVIFEGDWSNMIGRYLENGDVRVPLFQKEAPVDAAPQEIVKEAPVVTPAPVVETPVVREYREPIVVQDPVVVHDRDVVVRDDVRRDVHVYGDHDRDVHVYGDHDRDVHVHGGGHYGHDGHDVYVHDDDDDVHIHGDGHDDHDVYVHDDDDHGYGHGGDGDGGYGDGDGGAGGDGLAAGGPWAIDPLGKTYGMGGTLAMGDTPGVGGFGTGDGSGSGPGTGPGMGPGSGPGTGPGTGPGPGDGSGEGDADGEGCDEGAGPGEGPGPEESENPNELEPKDNPGPGNGAGGMGNMTNMINLAPQYRQRVRNLAPKMKLPEVPTFYGPDILVYNPQVPYWNPQLPYYNNPGYGYGGGGGGGFGNGGGGGGYPPVDLSGANLGAPEMTPGMVLYISCGDENSSGKVYQVDEQGRVLGMVNLPDTATGIAMHKDFGLICTCPREGGKIYRISDGGMVEPILEQDPKMTHPVDVAVGPDSDSMVVADNIADTISLSNVQGKALDTYKKFEGLQHLDRKNMSVAVTKDRAIIYGTDGDTGVYRFSGNAAMAKSTPVLPEAGGVAADTATELWAATQGSDRIVVMDGETPVREYKLPSGKFFYHDGLLSFAPPAGLEECVAGSGIVAAMRDSSDSESAPYLIEFKTDADGKVDQRLLFNWDKDRMVDFVVGPRMLWEQNNRSTYNSRY